MYACLYEWPPCMCVCVSVFVSLCVLMWASVFVWGSAVYVCVCVYVFTTCVWVSLCVSVWVSAMFACMSVWYDVEVMVESRGCWCPCSWRSDGSESPNISAENWTWMLCRSKYSQRPSHLFSSHSFIFFIILELNFWITEDRYRIQILVMLPNGLQITGFSVSNLEVHGHHNCSTSLTILFCFVFYFCPFYGCLNFL